MAQDGDWACEVCGFSNFASREECFKCAKKEGGGAGGPRAKQEGDWACEVCGFSNFASREECFKCAKGGGGGAGGPRAKQEGDWECPDCGFNVFANKSSCPKCERIASGEPPKGKAAGKGKSGGKAALPATLSSSVKTISKQSKVFQKAWNSYCDAYGEGWKDPMKHEDAFLVEFVAYAAGLITADLQKEGVLAAEPAAEEGQEAPAAKVAPAGQKRAAAQAPPAAPAEKKKVTVKKAVATKVQALNDSGALMSPIRLGAVAGALSQLDEANQLDALAILEEQAADIEDPNEFLKSQAQVLLSAEAEEA